MSTLVCPSCASLDVIGHEVSHIYDGVLFWSCLACLTAWSRDWTGYGYRAKAAATFVQQFNDMRDAAAAAKP